MQQRWLADDFVIGKLGRAACGIQKEVCPCGVPQFIFYRYLHAFYEGSPRFIGKIECMRNY